MNINELTMRMVPVSFNPRSVVSACIVVNSKKSMSNYDDVWEQIRERFSRAGFNTPKEETSVYEVKFLDTTLFIGFHMDVFAIGVTYVTLKGRCFEKEGESNL